MSKQSWFTILTAATMLLPGCSNDNENLSLEEDRIGDSDIEIVLSSGSNTSTSRASINSDENKLFEVNGIGIFCAAKDKQGVNSPAPDIDWRRYNQYGKTDIQLFNIEANAVKVTQKDEEGKDFSFSQIQWAETNKHYYYPISNWYKYDFYGYYPFQQQNNIAVSNNYITVTMDIDGSQDVLWGKASSDENYAYSAKYYRMGQHDVPVINFKHVLTRFTFSVTAGEDYTGNKSNATRMKISSVKLQNMPYMLTLMAAGSNESQEEGTVSANNYIVRDFALLDENDAPLTPIQVQEEGTLKVGESLMPVAGLDVYGICITLKDEKGNEYLSEFPLRIDNETTDYPISGTFALAGHSYNILMTVYGPQEIGISATLEPWIIEEEDVKIEL